MGNENCLCVALQVQDLWADVYDQCVNVAQVDEGEICYEFL